MKKFFKEFKDFINRGSVMDLAVGMIIGAAFTAIITAVVNGILKPLINLIPIGDKTGLQTVLRQAVVDENGEILTEALILDWGGVISAIIIFHLTAFVLFLIIKAYNNAQKGLGKVKRGFLVLIKPEVRALRKEGKTWAEIKAIDADLAAKKAAEEKAATEAKAAAAAIDPTDEILKEIRDILKEKK